MRFEGAFNVFYGLSKPQYLTEKGEKTGSGGSEG